MPLNAKGKKIKAAMKREYGSKKGEQVFYASENKGTVKGVTKSEGKADMPHGKHGGMHGTRTPGAAKKATRPSRKAVFKRTRQGTRSAPGPVTTPPAKSAKRLAKKSRPAAKRPTMRRY